jgi:hypothetical protein
MTNVSIAGRRAVHPIFRFPTPPAGEGEEEAASG